jgi:hypothetical protein
MSSKFAGTTGDDREITKKQQENQANMTFGTGNFAVLRLLVSIFILLVCCLT